MPAPGLGIIPAVRQSTRNKDRERIAGIDPGVRVGYRDYSARATANSAQRAMMGFMWRPEAPLPLAAPRGPVELSLSLSLPSSDVVPPVTAAPAAATGAVAWAVEEAL
jgi:hypothetical protein